MTRLSRPALNPLGQMRGPDLVYARARETGSGHFVRGGGVYDDVRLDLLQVGFHFGRYPRIQIVKGCDADAAVLQRADMRGACEGALRSYLSG